MPRLSIVIVTYNSRSDVGGCLESLTRAGAVRTDHEVIAVDNASVGYDPDINTLEIEFRNRRLYQYFAVPKHIFDGLMTAESKGSYFNGHIKDRFPVKRVS